VTCDSLVQNSGFEVQIIADLRAILGVLPGQRYRGASGGLRGWPVTRGRSYYRVLFWLEATN
jgi:hypothetical protein